MDQDEKPGNNKPKTETIIVKPEDGPAPPAPPAPKVRQNPIQQLQQQQLQAAEQQAKAASQWHAISFTLAQQLLEYISECPPPPGVPLKTGLNLFNQLKVIPTIPGSPDKLVLKEEKKEEKKNE